MNLVFMGTPDFAVPSLRALVEAGHCIHSVYTQPDRPAGRGGKLTASPVKETALELGLPVEQPRRIRQPEVVETLRTVAPDVIIVVGYGHIIPKSIIDIPPMGIVNVHGSLLPKYRGAAPIQWAVANGESVTGITTMLINEGLDTGDMLLKAETAIAPDETAVAVWYRLADVGAKLLIETLAGVAAGTIVPEKQNDAHSSYAPMLKREDGLIDWEQPAAIVYNRYRGFQPWPGAWSTFRGGRFQVKEMRLGPERNALPGTLISEKPHLLAACGDGRTVELLRVQLEGKAPVAAEAFRNGAHLQRHERLGSPAPAAE